MGIYAVDFGDFDIVSFAVRFDDKLNSRKFDFAVRYYFVRFYYVAVENFAESALEVIYESRAAARGIIFFRRLGCVGFYVG